MRQTARKETALSTPRPLDGDDQDGWLDATDLLPGLSSISTLSREAQQALAGGIEDQGRPQRIRISQLAYGGSPRLGGEDPQHTMQLLESDVPMPPIIVHRHTLQVIDGAHRVFAAAARGREEIEAVFFDGPPEAAFILAVATNVFHGLPLTLPDRRAAAKRILRTHGHWSDRSIARSTGLSAKTIGRLRHLDADDDPEARVGDDGRVRPLSTAAGRRAAADFLATHPESSLRTVARFAGISPGTARDVRARIQRGEDPVLPQRSKRDEPMATPDEEHDESQVMIRETTADVLPVLATLARDPAMRMSKAGRDLLRWLHVHAVNRVDTAKIVESAPDHCVSNLAELASICASNWASIANDLAHRNPT